MGDALASSKRSGKSTVHRRWPDNAFSYPDCRAARRRIYGQTEERCGRSEGELAIGRIPRATNMRVAPSRILVSQHTVSVLESVARAHLLTAALMPAEPHIRSPFAERLAPQSLILEVIGLGRAGPHCIAAYHSPCLRRSARPDPTRLIRPRGTCDNDSGLPECLSLLS